MLPFAIAGILLILQTTLACRDVLFLVDGNEGSKWRAHSLLPWIGEEARVGVLVPRPAGRGAHVKREESRVSVHALVEGVGRAVHSDDLLDAVAYEMFRHRRGELTVLIFSSAPPAAWRVREWRRIAQLNERLNVLIVADENGGFMPGHKRVRGAGVALRDVLGNQRGGVETLWACDEKEMKTEERMKEIMRRGGRRRLRVFERARRRRDTDEELPFDAAAFGEQSNRVTAGAFPTLVPVTAVDGTATIHTTVSATPPTTTTTTAPTTATTERRPPTTTVFVAPARSVDHSPSTTRSPRKVTRATGPRSTIIFKRGTTGIVFLDGNQVITTRPPTTRSAATFVPIRVSRIGGGNRIDSKQEARRPSVGALSFPVTRAPSLTTTYRPTTPPPPGCQADIIFLLDFSGGTREFADKFVRLAVEITRTLPVGEGLVRIGAVRYSGPGRTETLFSLSKHKTHEGTVLDLNKEHLVGGTTRTGEALSFALSQLEKARKGVPRSVVVFSDGYSQDDPASAAEALRRAGVQVVAVAVRDRLVPPDQQQLTTITGDSKRVLIDPTPSTVRQIVLGSRCRL